MPDFQSGQAIAVDYKAETTFGTLPTATAARRFRLTGGGLTPDATPIESPEFRGDGQTVLPRLGLKSGTGGYGGQLSVGTFDPLFEAVIRGTWTADVLLPAAVPVNRSFSFEEYRSILNESIRFTGARVVTTEVSAPANAPTTVNFGVLAQNYAIATGKYFTSPTITDTEGLIATDQAILLGGAPAAAVTSSGFRIDLRGQNQAVAGTRLSPDVWTSAMRITGSVSLMRSDAAMLTNFVNETPLAYQSTWNDPLQAISLQVLIPRIRFTGFTPGLGTDGPEIVTLAFTAGYDTVTGGMIRMTRDLTP